MNGVLWTPGQTEWLHRMAESGMSMREAATDLGKTYKSVQQKVLRDRIDFRNKQIHIHKTPDEKLRERWLKLLPEMKEALRRDLEINI